MFDFTCGAVCQGRLVTAVTILTFVIIGSVVVLTVRAFVRPLFRPDREPDSMAAAYGDVPHTIQVRRPSV